MYKIKVKKVTYQVKSKSHLYKNYCFKLFLRICFKITKCFQGIIENQIVVIKLHLPIKNLRINMKMILLFFEEVNIVQTRYILFLNQT